MCGGGGGSRWLGIIGRAVTSAVSRDPRIVRVIRVNHPSTPGHVPTHAPSPSPRSSARRYMSGGRNDADVIRVCPCRGPRSEHVTSRRHGSELRRPLACWEARFSKSMLPSCLVMPEVLFARLQTARRMSSTKPRTATFLVPRRGARLHRLGIAVCTTNGVRDPVEDQIRSRVEQD